MSGNEGRVPGEVLRQVFGGTAGTKLPPGCVQAHPPVTTCGPACVWGVARAISPGKQRTIAILKPDAVARCLVQPVVHRILMHFTVLRAGRLTMTRGPADTFYAEHEDKPFFSSLINFMANGEMVLLLLEGISVIDRWRALLGATDPRQAEPWTIRGEFGNKDGVVWENIAHGSSSPEDAHREIDFFRGDEWLQQRDERWSPSEGVWVAEVHLAAIARPLDPGANFDVVAAAGRLKRVFAQRPMLAQQGAVEAAVARGIRNRHELELVLDALGLSEGGPARVEIVEGHKVG